MSNTTRPLRMAIARATATTAGRANADAIVAARLRVFCLALSQTLGEPVEPHVAEDYRALADAVASGEIDMAWLPPLLGLRLTAQGHATIVAVPVRVDGASLSATLFVDAAGSVVDLDTAMGRSVAWVDRFSTAGYLIPRALLRASGAPAEHLFAEQHVLGSHSEVVRAVFAGDVAVGASYLYRSAAGEVLRAGWGDRDARILLEYGPIPADVLAASVRLPSEQATRVSAGLHAPGTPILAGAFRELFEAQSLAPASADHFETLAQLAPHFESDA